MTARLRITLTCSHPDCGVSVDLDAGGYGSIRDRPRNLPDGWEWHGPELHGCPTHAPELRAADKEAYEWAVKRTNAYNKAIRELKKAHPRPSHPEWLATIWDERDRF